MTNALTLFQEEGDVIEIRVISGKKVFSGYFKDANKAMEEAMKHDGKANIYFILNKINEACYHRENKDKLVDQAQSTTDSEIEKRRWILIDFDPIRPTKTSSTDSEKEKAYLILQKAARFLKEKKFSDPIIADSGNGWHLLYKIDLDNGVDNKALLELFLKACDMLFSTDEVKVDTVVYNAARITKLYGTIAVKGASTTERPHRGSSITFVPKSISETPRNIISAIVQMLPAAPKKNTSTIQSEFSIQDFMSKNNISVRKTATLGDGTKHILSECPFDSSHGKDSAIIELRNGALSFHCFHNGCSQNGWKELREMYDPEQDRPRKEYQKQEYKQKERKPLTIEPETSATLDEATMKLMDKAVCVSTIKKLDRKNMKIFKTNIPSLDKKMELVFGKLVVMSGINGSGKSTLLGQIMLEALEQNENIFTYSGELMDNEFQYWLDLQAAGPKNLIPNKSSQGKEYFDIKSKVCAEIHEWYKDRFFLYKNEESMEFSEILKTVDAFRVHKKCNVIFLDNFLTMDISNLDDKDLVAQTIFINSLAKYAKKHKVIIFLVIHPKKVYKGICAKGDILGSGNLTNAIDYLIIIHRNNEAWKLAMKDRILSKETQQYLLNCTNIIDIQKDRWTGAEGLNVALTYRMDSKRLVDIKHMEICDKTYSWEHAAELENPFEN